MSIAPTSARSRGSARTGVEHWKMQRLTAIAGVPLLLWLIVSAMALAGTDYAGARAWLAHPFNTTMMLLLLIAMFWHARLGLQVVIEDYVHHEGAKVASLIAVSFAVFLFGGLAAVSVLKVALGS
jgi:succinate dehydrogenase / fumarate reductase, membrane anchor subunit